MGIAAGESRVAGAFSAFRARLLCGGEHERKRKIDLFLVGLFCWRAVGGEEKTLLSLGAG